MITEALCGLPTLLSKEIGTRCRGLMKPLRDGLGFFVACMLSERTSNLMVLGSVLPRSIGNNEHRYQYLARILKTPELGVFEVMQGFAAELFIHATRHNKTAILMLDQSKISDGFECLMLSLRVGNRAVPLLWRVVETRGAIGWDVSRPLLEQLMEIMPIGTKCCLMADRFYGHGALIDWCQSWGISYRIRLRNNLILKYEGGETTTGKAASLGLAKLEDAKLGEVSTHIGILHEEGHAEPWIIAMDAKPTKARVLDYGMRWGIEAMFSDFKSRGFGITQTKLRHADRIERLVLVMAIAMISAVFLGLNLKGTEIGALSKKLSDLSNPLSLKA